MTDNSTRTAATPAELAANMAMAAHHVEALATELEELAARLRRLSRGFARSNQSAFEVAADIVNDFIQGTGVIGSRLWGVLHEAAKAAEARNTLRGTRREQS